MAIYRDVLLLKIREARGLRGRSPFVKITVNFRVLSPPKNSCIWLCCSQFIDLASKVFCIAMINYSLLYHN